jgi:hypothetical protein
MCRHPGNASAENNCKDPLTVCSITHSPPFTFLVGHNHTKITIQSALVKHVSRPLDRLMNNGETRESKVRIAVLEDEEVEVFVAFCEYAYTSDYTVPPGPEEELPRISDQWTNMMRTRSSASFIPPPVPSPPPERVHSKEETGNDEEKRGDPADISRAQEGTGDEGNPLAGQGEEGFSFSTAEKKNKKKGKKDKKKQKAAFFEEPTAGGLTPPSTPPPDAKEEPAQEETEEDTPKEAAVEETPKEEGDDDIAVETDPESPAWWDHPVSPRTRKNTTGHEAKKEQDAPIIDTSFASQPISARAKGFTPWGEFTSLEYVHEPLSTYDPSTRRAFWKPRAPYLVFHAKVYVFATRYLIPGLAQLCLKKLHRDLLELPLNPDSGKDDEDEEEATNFEARAKMILDLLQYTYSKTARFEPLCQTSATLLRESELRKLVAQYAACKMRELAAYTPVSLPMPTSPSHGPGSGVNVVAAPGLRELLDNTTELASDLVYRMM